MNYFQRLAVRLAAWFVPSLRKLLATTGGTVERLSEEVLLLRERSRIERSHIQEQRAEIREAMAMAGSGPWQAGLAQRFGESGSSGTSLPNAPVALKERLAELELALEDRGWQREMRASEWEFSRWGIQLIILMCRLYFIKNPLIRRGIQVSSYYVFGRGVEISSDDEPTDEALRDFFDDPANAAEISHTGLVSKEESLHTDGNLFFAFFTAADTGKTLIRSIDAIEIEEIITDPDDSSVPWYYHRKWSQQTFDPRTGVTIPILQDAWYVALGYDSPEKQIAGKPLMTGTDGQLIPLLHYKVGGLPKWRFGCPLAYSALDWARAYRHFLEDWATITRALARFSWQVETQGGPAAIAGFKATLATTLANDAFQSEQNPPPVTASAFVSGPGNKLTPVKTAGATTEPEQGRRVLLMVCAAFGLPETFFGDVSVGTLATADSLDRPTELKFMERQESWREVLQRIGQYVLDRSAKAPSGKLKEAKAKAQAKAKAAGEDPEEPAKIVIDVDFPAILEGDVPAKIASIVSCMQYIDEKLGVTLLLTELGVEDVQAVVDAMYPPDTYQIEKPPPVQIDPLTGAPPKAPPEGAKKASEAVVIKAVDELKRALVKLQEKQAA